MHAAAMTARGWLVGGATNLGGNEGSYSLLVRMTMVGLGIVACVGQNRRGSACRQCLVQQGDEAIDISRRSAAHQHGQEQMAVAIDSGLQLGKTAIGHSFPGLVDFLPTTHVVKTAPPQIESGGMESGARQVLAAF